MGRWETAGLHGLKVIIVAFATVVPSSHGLIDATNVHFWPEADVPARESANACDVFRPQSDICSSTEA